MNGASDPWDAGLARLVEEEIARRVGDIRAILISEISRTMFGSDALAAANPEKLAEIAVDVMIEFSRKARTGDGLTGGSSAM